MSCILRILQLILLNSVVITSSQCIIDINEDRDELQPLIIKPEPWQTFGNHPYYMPGNREDQIMFDSDQRLFLHCPGGAIRAGGVTYANGILEIACRIHESFTIVETDAVFKFAAIKCQIPPQHSVRRTREKCTGNGDILEIGFQLNDGVFITQISICFDSTLKTTLYVKSQMSARIDSIQYSVPRRFFQEGGSFFNLGTDVEQCYNFPRQRMNINRLFGLPLESWEVINRRRSFTRGHLAAKGDFVYSAQQVSTFYFVNAVPQWNRLNNDNWNDLEQSVRILAAHKRKDLIIYTGTFGVVTYRNRQIFLHRDELRERIPVPEFFWKVVYEPEAQEGVAFIASNDPFDFGVVPFCTDVCLQINWPITWTRFNRERGFAFCCDVNELRHFVDFPQFPVSRLLTD